MAEGNWRTIPCSCSTALSTLPIAVEACFPRVLTIEQIYREYTLRPGRVVVRGHKASRDKKSVLRADYVLFYKTSIPLAVIEAKDKGGVVQVQDQNTEHP